MAQPTLLNLDDFRVTRTVVISGKERLLKNMTVEQFIAAGDLEARLGDAGNERAQIPILIDIILDYLEDTDRAELMKLDVGQLLVLLAFIRGVDVAPKGAEAGTPGEAKAGRRKAAAS